MWIRSLRNNNDCTFKISYDGDELDSVKPSGPSRNGWQQVGTKTSSHVAKANGQGLSIQVTCDAFKGPLFYIDDISIIPVKGPAGEPICSASAGPPLPIQTITILPSIPI
jgi:hypothetical protein